MTLSRLSNIRRERPAFVGCLHLLPLCGSHGWSGAFQPIVDRALREADLYVAAGVDGLIIENTHDAPYQRVTVDAGTIAGVAIVAHAVRTRFPCAVGVQVLAGADLAAIDIAALCSLDFVRVEGFAFAHVADEGIIQGDAAGILRRRAHIKADGVEVWADVKKKHSSHAITGDLPLREAARGAVYCGADGLIVTGGHTGEPPTIDDVKAVSGLGALVVVGSGVDASNIASFGAVADALIVGSACKTGGDWRQPVDAERTRELVANLRAVRSR